jgi:hypothetical protein
MQDEIAAAGGRIFDREKQRAASIANIAPGGPRPEAIKEKPEPKASEYKGVAAAEMGGAEAGSAIAKFLNVGAGDDAQKKTADNTGQLVKQTKSVVKALEEIKARTANQAAGLGAFPI